jgi:hypothetical protein
MGTKQRKKLWHFFLPLGKKNKIQKHNENMNRSGKAR